MAGKNRKPVKNGQAKLSPSPISEKKTLLSRKISISWNLSFLKGVLPVWAAFGILANFFLFSCWFWDVRYADLLYLTSNYDTPADFTDSRTWYGMPLDTPAFIPQFCGQWILAFCAYPALGGTVLALLGAVLAGLFFSIWGRTAWSMLFALIPVSLLMILIPFQGYSFFGCYSAAPFYGVYAGLIFSAGVGLRGNCLAGRRSWLLLTAAVILLGYPAFGVFALIAGLFLLTSRLKQGSYKCAKDFRPDVLIAVLIPLAPVLWTPYYRAVYPAACLPWAGFFFQTDCKLDPVFLHGAYDLNRILIGAVLVPALGCWGLFLTRRISEWKRSRKIEKIEAEPVLDGTAPETTGTAGQISSRSLRTVLCAFLFAVLVMAGTAAGSREDANFLTACSLFRALETGDWERILTEEANTAEPSLPLIEARRLALIKTGRAGSAFFDRPNVPVVTPEMERVSTARILGASILYYYGNINAAYRYAIESLVFLRDRSPYDTKIAFLASVVNEEYELASIYADHLAKIAVFRPWGDAAEDVLSVLHRGGDRTQISALAQYWLGTIERARLLRPKDGGIDTGKFISPSVFETAPYRDMESIPFADAEGTLMAILLSGNLELFNERFALYYQRLKAEKGTDAPIPPVFQQVWAYEYAVNPALEEKGVYPIDDSVKAGWEKMDILSMRRARTGDAGGEITAQLEQEFGRTWWYYFFHNYQQAVAY